MDNTKIFVGVKMNFVDELAWFYWWKFLRRKSRMGNQASLAQQASATNHVPGEPLESFSKEKLRDDHLKNLGFKRSKSIRKSIAKRLKRKKPNPSLEDIKDGVSKTSKTSEASSLDTRVEVVERPSDKSDKPLVGIPQPLPVHVQVYFDSEIKVNFLSSFCKMMFTQWSTIE